MLAGKEYYMKYKLETTISRKTLDSMDKIRARLRYDSYAQVIEKAITVYEHIGDELAAGNKITLRIRTADDIKTNSIPITRTESTAQDTTIPTHCGNETVH